MSPIGGDPSVPNTQLNCVGRLNYQQNNLSVFIEQELSDNIITDQVKFKRTNTLPLLPLVNVPGIMNKGSAVMNETLHI